MKRWSIFAVFGGISPSASENNKNGCPQCFLAFWKLTDIT